jgi:hypothetical protein
MEENLLVPASARPQILIDQDLNEQFSEDQLQDVVKNVAHRCGLLGRLPPTFYSLCESIERS